MAKLVFKVVHEFGPYRLLRASAVDSRGSRFALEMKSGQDLLGIGIWSAIAVWESAALDSENPDVVLGAVVRELCLVLERANAANGGLA